MGEEITAVSIRRQMTVEHWIQLVSECRGSGLPVRAWCRQQGINSKTYYSWERKILQTVSRQRSLCAGGRFAEVPVIPALRGPEDVQPAAVLRVGELRCGIREGISPELLQLLVRVMKDNA